MKGTAVFSCLVLIVLAGAAAEPIGLDVTVESGAEDVLGSDWDLYLQPGMSYAFGTSGLTAEVTRQVPFLPGVDPGTVEGVQEYQILLPPLTITLGNDDEMAVSPLELDGYVYASARRKLGDFSVELEMDFGYAPEASVTAVGRLAWEKDIAHNTLALEVDENVDLYQELALGDTEFSASYEATLPNLTVTFEVDPTVTASLYLDLSMSVAVTYSL